MLQISEQQRNSIILKLQEAPAKYVYDAINMLLGLEGIEEVKKPKKK